MWFLEGYHWNCNWAMDICRSPIRLLVKALIYLVWQHLFTRIIGSISQRSSGMRTLQARSNAHLSHYHPLNYTFQISLYPFFCCFPGQKWLKWKGMELADQMRLAERRDPSAFLLQNNKSYKYKKRNNLIQQIGKERKEKLISSFSGCTCCCYFGYFTTRVTAVINYLWYP